MGRNLVSVMVDDPALDRVVKSRDSAQLPFVSAACSGLEPNKGQKLALAERLINGDFAGEEAPDGHLFLHLFEDVCRAVAGDKQKHWTAAEIHVDDQFPEMWEFVF